MQIDAAEALKPEPFESRHLGEYLLAAELGHDALGTVYRALDSADDRRFVRLRVLQSGELNPQEVLAAIGKNEKAAEALFNQAIVRRARFGVRDGIPFLAWYETAGWTLDTVLARVRALKLQLSSEQALLIAARVTEALEHAHRTVQDGEPVHHGILWPGFVSISNDADVRVGGFGLADAVLPVLHKPRLANEIAPYVAPEARELGIVGDSSDVYSLGVLLLELMTGRRPSLASPPDLRAGDPISREIGDFLRRCLASPSERFRSAAEMRQALREILDASPDSLSPASLALFLYRLLNPESRSVLPSADLDSTNPVAVEPTPSRATAFESPLASALPPSPERPEELLPQPVAAAPPPLKMPWGRVAVTVLAVLTITGATLFLTRPRGASPQEDARIKETPPASEARTIRERAAFSPSPETEIERPEAPPQPSDPASRVENAVMPLSAPPLAAGPPARSGNARPERPSGRSERASQGDTSAAIASARGSRFQAGLARVEAERLDARSLAADVFGRGEDIEKEADRLLRERDYDAAQRTFRRATETFRMAENLSREERVRRVRLDSP